MIRLRPSGADEVLIKRVRDWYEPGPGVFISPQTLFSPALLFTGSTTGTWYDPSDFSTLFQDAAGTTPVTAVEQPVGLMLDKSKGLVLGSELVTNGDFSNGLTGWTSGSFSSAVLQDGGAKIERSADSVTNTALLWLAPAATAKRYRITFDVLSGSGTLLLNGSTSVTASAGKKTLIVGPGNSDTLIELRCFAGSFAVVDNISVRELPGNHAFNASGNSANFPVLSARYNLLTSTEDLTSASWQKLSSGTGSLPVVTPGQADPLGGTTAFRVRSNRGAGNTSSDYSILRCSTSAVTSARRSLWVKSNTGATQTARLSIAVTATQISITTSWQLITTDSSDSTARFDLASFGTDGTTNDLDILVWHPDMRVSNDALNQPAYQRVNTATDYDTVGFKPYLNFNGTNQWLQTNSIDFSYGDKMFVCAGVRKLSDATRGMLAELGAASNGAFQINAPTSSLSGYLFQSTGTGGAGAAVAGYTAPTTNVLSGIGDISGDQSILRIDGSQAAISTADQGTGNFGNYPLYIGVRAGTSLWFNGRLHQLVVAGKQASASEIGQTEAFTNQKTGAY